MKLLQTSIGIAAVLFTIGCASQAKLAANEDKHPTQVEILNQFSEAQIAQGKTLMDTRCGRCHDLKPTDSFTVDEWEPILERMIPKAKLLEDEGNLVRAYILLNAKS